MPSATKKQHNLMAAVAHNPAFAKRVGIPQSVGRDFTEADKGRHFERGGNVKEPKGMMKKEIAFMKKKGAPKSMIKHEEAEAKEYKVGGKIPMKETMGPRNMSKDVEAGSNKLRPFGESAVQKRGHTRDLEEKMPKGPGATGLNPGVPTAKFSKGGHVKHGEHSIQKKGHTRGRII